MGDVKQRSCRSTTRSLWWLLGLMARPLIRRRRVRDYGHLYSSPRLATLHFLAPTRMSSNYTANATSQVLIVGARTTGLMLAIRLLRQGLTVKIVDDSPGIDPHSRATLLHSRSLELLKGMGLAGEIMANGQPLCGNKVFTNGVEVINQRDTPVDSPYPYGLAYSQAKIEALLEHRLNQLGVEVERNTTLIALEQETDRVHATLRPQDGSGTVVSAPWLVGCDGAHSSTRKLLDIALEGDDSPHPYILADVLATNDTAPDKFYYYLHDEGHFFMAVLDEGRRLVAGSLPPEHPAKGTPELAEIQSISDQRTGGAHTLSDPRWLTYFRIHYRLAERYRSGRVFLAGDAAHVNSPFGGHGMNTGLQDACNLAWKLSLATKGVASEALLDSYEAERRPVAKAVIADSRSWTEPGEAYPKMNQAERQELLASYHLNEEENVAFRRGFEELDLDYGASPLCLDDDESLPEALRPGLEAKDATGLILKGSRCCLFDLLSGPSHCLLIFPQDESNLEKGVDTARAVQSAHHAWVIPYLVWTQDDVADEGLSCLVDSDHVLRQRYGMEAGGMYLIRPDGYISFRSRELDRLPHYVDQVLAPAPAR